MSPVSFQLAPHGSATRSYDVFYSYHCIGYARTDRYTDQTKTHRKSIGLKGTIERVSDNMIFLRQKFEVRYLIFEAITFDFRIPHSDQITNIAS
jgi:hypothetical protein